MTPQRSFWYALWYANTEDSLATLKVQRGGKSQGDLHLIDYLLARTRFDILEFNISSGPILLDMYWGGFFATGDTNYVHAVMKALSLLDAPNDSPEYAIAQSALWSLTTLAHHQKRVHDFCRHLHDSSPEGGFKILMHGITEKGLHGSAC